MQQKLLSVICCEFWQQFVCVFTLEYGKIWAISPAHERSPMSDQVLVIESFVSRDKQSESKTTLSK
jgi:hypothetical protein